MKRDGARPVAAPLFFGRRGSGGWTLVELVITLVIGVVLMYFVVRTYAPKQAQALQQAERLRSDVRHVQMLALTLNKTLELKLGAAPGACATATYWVIDCTAFAPDPCATAPNTPIADPATGKNFCVTMESGLGLTLSTTNLYFDPLGRPKNAGALIPAAATLTVTGGSPDRSLTVDPVTGFASKP